MIRLGGERAMIVMNYTGLVVRKRTSLDRRKLRARNVRILWGGRDLFLDLHDHNPTSLLFDLLSTGLAVIRLYRSL